MRHDMGGIRYSYPNSSRDQLTYSTYINLGTRSWTLGNCLGSRKPPGYFYPPLHSKLRRDFPLPTDPPISSLQVPPNSGRLPSRLGTIGIRYLA